MILFFESTIMGNTADLAMVQKTIIDTSTKRVSHRRSLLKGVALHRVLYKSILNATLTGRNKLDRKMCTSNRDDRKLENNVKQSRFKRLGELHKEWTEAGVSASRVTTLRHLQEKSYQPPQKHPTWAKEKKNWPVAQWSKVLCAWLASKLAWPEPYREPMGFCQEKDEIHQTQQCRWAEGRYQSNLGFITPEQCHRLIDSMPRRIDAVIHAKGGPTKYWVLCMLILFRSLTFLFKIKLLWILCNIQIC